MAPKKRNFHTPRNAKSTPVSKSNEKKIVESNSEANKNVDINSNLSTAVADSAAVQKDKYSKRTVESNWTKYEEPVSDPHGDSMRGENFDVLLSYSGGSGSQLKLQDEKEWEDEYIKDISLHIPDLINTIKCIPFHERIGRQDIFDEKTIANFIESSRKFLSCYKSQSKFPVLEHKDLSEEVTDITDSLNIIEETDAAESDDYVLVKNFPVQDKTEDIINSLAANLSFKNFSEKVETEMPEEENIDEKKLEAASDDLDFLLSLNIPSKLSIKKEESSTSKTNNVDDWLNSILDD